MHGDSPCSVSGREIWAVSTGNSARRRVVVGMKTSHTLIQDLKRYVDATLIQGGQSAVTM
jgi:hypothetical protein